MGEKINASVGLDGFNVRADVIVVQKLLNAAGAKLVADGACGPKTIHSIKAYQKNYSARPDGRVDVNGNTWKKLLEGKLRINVLALAPQPFLLLPQMSGVGYYPYSPMLNQYGTSETVAAIQQICMQFRTNMPDVQIGIGDMSFQNGGPMQPHKSHQHGTHVDVRPLRKDKKNIPVSIADANYSRELTKILVECIQSHRNYKSVLFNDNAIKGTTNYAGHHNHLHVSFKA